jgi:hypothetical protein
MRAGWLDDLTNWLVQRLQELYDFMVQTIEQALVAALEMFLNVFASLLEAIPVPEWIQNYDLNSILGAGGPWVNFVMGQLQLGTAFALIAGGWAFRLVRKALTLGQW